VGLVKQLCFAAVSLLGAMLVSASISLSLFLTAALARRTVDYSPRFRGVCYPLCFSGMVGSRGAKRTFHDASSLFIYYSWARCQTRTVEQPCAKNTCHLHTMQLCGFTSAERGEGHRCWPKPLSPASTWGYLLRRVDTTGAGTCCGV
jgi:hypothetical protein